MTKHLSHALISYRRSMRATVSRDNCVCCTPMFFVVRKQTVMNAP